MIRYMLGSACVLSLACAAENKQIQIEHARERFRAYQQYQVPQDYREQLDRYFETVLNGSGSRTVMLAAPDGAIVCGHVNPKSQGGFVGYLPFGAIFDRGGSLRWVRVYQPFQGMYTTSTSDPRATDDDVAIAIACSIPLVF